MIDRPNILQLQEINKKPDTPRGMDKEAEFKFFKKSKKIFVPSSRGLSSSPLFPLNMTEPREIVVKNSGCRCIVM